MDTNRNADGRYTYSRFDRLCTCGHTLGCHTADRDARARVQPCIDSGTDCDCEFFVAAKRAA